MISKFFNSPLSMPGTIPSTSGLLKAREIEPRVPNNTPPVRSERPSVSPSTSSGSEIKNNDPRFYLPEPKKAGQKNSNGPDHVKRQSTHAFLGIYQQYKYRGNNMRFEDAGKRAFRAEKVETPQVRFIKDEQKLRSGITLEAATATLEHLERGWNRDYETLQSPQKNTSPVRFFTFEGAWKKFTSGTRKLLSFGVGSDPLSSKLPQHMDVRGFTPKSVSGDKTAYHRENKVFSALKQREKKLQSESDNPLESATHPQPYLASHVLKNQVEKKKLYLERAEELKNLLDVPERGFKFPDSDLAQRLDELITNIKSGQEQAENDLTSAITDLEIQQNYALDSSLSQCQKTMAAENPADIETALAELKDVFKAIQENPEFKTGTHFYILAPTIQTTVGILAHFSADEVRQVAKDIQTCQAREEASMNDLNLFRSHTRPKDGYTLSEATKKLFYHYGSLTGGAPGLNCLFNLNMDSQGAKGLNPKGIDFQALVTLCTAKTKLETIEQITMGESGSVAEEYKNKAIALYSDAIAGAERILQNVHDSYSISMAFKNLHNELDKEKIIEIFDLLQNDNPTDAIATANALLRELGDLTTGSSDEIVKVKTHLQETHDKDHLINACEVLKKLIESNGIVQADQCLQSVRETMQIPDMTALLSNSPPDKERLKAVIKELQNIHSELDIHTDLASHEAVAFSLVGNGLDTSDPAISHSVKWCEDSLTYIQRSGDALEGKPVMPNLFGRTKFKSQDPRETAESFNLFRRKSANALRQSYLPGGVKPFTSMHVADERLRNLSGLFDTLVPSTLVLPYAKPGNQDLLHFAKQGAKIRHFCAALSKDEQMQLAAMFFADMKYRKAEKDDEVTVTGHFKSIKIDEKKETEIPVEEGIHQGKTTTARYGRAALIYPYQLNQDRELYVLLYKSLAEIDSGQHFMEVLSNKNDADRGKIIDAEFIGIMESWTQSKRQKELGTISESTSESNNRSLDMESMTTERDFVNIGDKLITRLTGTPDETMERMFGSPEKGQELLQSLRKAHLTVDSSSDPEFNIDMKSPEDVKKFLMQILNTSGPGSRVHVETGTRRSNPLLSLTQFFSTTLTAGTVRISMSSDNIKKYTMDIGWQSTGVEIAITQHHSKERGLGGKLSAPIPFVSLGPVASSQWAKKGEDTLTIRVPRTGNDEEALEKLRNVVHILFPDPAQNISSPAPVQEKSIHGIGPLMAKLFIDNPALSISQSTLAQKTSSLSLGASLGVSVPGVSIGSATATRTRIRDRIASKDTIGNGRIERRAETTMVVDNMVANILSTGASLADENGKGLDDHGYTFKVGGLSAYTYTRTNPSKFFTLREKLSTRHRAVNPFGTRADVEFQTWKQVEPYLKKEREFWIDLQAKELKKTFPDMPAIEQIRVANELLDGLIADTKDSAEKADFWTFALLHWINRDSKTVLEALLAQCDLADRQNNKEMKDEADKSIRMLLQNSSTWDPFRYVCFETGRYSDRLGNPILAPFYRETSSTSARGGQVYPLQDEFGLSDTNNEPRRSNQSSVENRQSLSRLPADFLEFEEEETKEEESDTEDIQSPRLPAAPPRFKKVETTETSEVDHTQAVPAPSEPENHVEQSTPKSSPKNEERTQNAYSQQYAEALNQQTNSDSQRQPSDRGVAAGVRERAMRELQKRGLNTTQTNNKNNY
ncbi:hypothetical protein ACO0LB_04345 [Undibacterium sp. SXout7W]|uniref:hypothetical protein n=1 Tax=Undibacterium sp. SXout7W TaxID=3413049 RepID=UPI003BF2F051